MVAERKQITPHNAAFFTPKGVSHGAMSNAGCNGWHLNVISDSAYLDGVIDMTHEEKLHYVKQAIVEGFDSYFDLTAKEIEQLDPLRLEIEYDAAKSWKGEE